ncbi:MAG: hypothetical protein H6973_18125 [Gammaproteobacteria bacterium]|nr:hypothetical protein [Gammaproteobacteria bacterium]
MDDCFWFARNGDTLIMRILPIELIPETMWKKQVLYLPGELITSYLVELKDRGLLQEAKQGTDRKDIHGGFSDKETLEHFTHRFGVSSGRSEFTILAPNEDLTEYSDALLNTFSEGHIGLLDIPCGTGASCVTFLTVLAELRARRVLPTLPLTISIVGGDCSMAAREICQSMLNRARTILADQGIIINYNLTQWDATRNDETAKMIDEWFKLASDACEYVVCISNFSGALIKGKMFDDFTPCLSQILARLHDKKSTLIWIEPINSNAVKGLIPKVFKWLNRYVPWFSNVHKKGEFPSAEYRMSNPINQHIHQTGVQVQRFVRD